jgi:hypothetical protein
VPDNARCLRTRRPKYQALFDPRCQRAANTGAAAQAEHVTGTHLYAFLQDTALAAGGKKSVPSVGAVEDQNGVDHIRELYTVRTRTIVAYLFSLCCLIACLTCFCVHCTAQAAAKLADAQLNGSLGLGPSTTDKNLVDSAGKSHTDSAGIYC